MERSPTPWNATHTFPSMPNKDPALATLEPQTTTYMRPNHVPLRVKVRYMSPPVRLEDSVQQSRAYEYRRPSPEQNNFHDPLSVDPYKSHKSREQANAMPGAGDVKSWRHHDNIFVNTQQWDSTGLSGDNGWSTHANSRIV